MIKALIFDCFGVLITDALEAIVSEFKAYDPDRAARIISTIVAANKGMIPSDQSRGLVAAELGITPDEYVQRIRDGEVKNQQLLDYIKLLRSHYKIGMLSNVGPKGLEVRFTPDELAAHFDVVIASGAIGYAKPEARAYEIVAAQLGVRLDECVMIDDREEYCEGARAVGMQAILYSSLPELKAELARLAH